ncbi:winged helix-turn-helix domain-containing protein [Massilia niastensis]|uniref:winged helix-turn-helix domain-containing protein n=1 Tax=Massilia niastensis TaxID=544911 RepID=UPI000375A74F|nr:transcriptional regulator [Massilia niastensis]
MDTGATVPQAISFLDFDMRPAQRQLFRQGERVAIGARAFDLLALLVEHPGEVLSKRTLMAGVWPRTVVVEANLRVQIAALRRLVGCDGPCPHIVNVAGRGYCFTAPVRYSADERALPVEPAYTRAPRTAPDSPGRTRPMPAWMAQPEFAAR